MYFSKTKEIVAIHDLSGIGRGITHRSNSYTYIYGISCQSLAYSNSFKPYTVSSFSFLDLTDEMRKIIAEWKKLNAGFDTFYSGYLGSPEQVQIVKDFIQEFRKDNNLVVVDPVLGDNGRLYAGFDITIVEEMRRLITVADIITPNLTELFYLLDIPYEKEYTDEKLKQYLLALSDKGPSIVIITSVPVADDPHQTSVYAYNRNGGRFWKVTCPYLPAHYPGVGDTFTSVITGAMMRGDSLPMALDRATQFCYQGIRATFGYEYDSREGILLEKVLHNLHIPIQVSTYELI